VFFFFFWPVSVRFLSNHPKWTATHFGHMWHQQQNASGWMLQLWMRYFISVEVVMGNPRQTWNYLHLFVFSHSHQFQWPKHWGTLCGSYSQSLKYFWLEGPSQMEEWREPSWQNLKFKISWHSGKEFLKAPCQIWGIIRYTLWLIGWYSGHTCITRITSISIVNNVFVADFEWRALLSQSEFQASLWLGHWFSHIALPHPNLVRNPNWDCPSPVEVFYT